MAMAAGRNVKRSRMRQLPTLVRGLLIAATLAVVSAQQSHAQSLFSCWGLEGAAVPMIEGGDGTFFRIIPDLDMNTRIPDAEIKEISVLSDAFASRGTTLVYVPIPTKAMSMPAALGQDGVKYGYDVRLARALYADSVAALRARGVTVVDAVPALHSPTGAMASHFGTDPRLTDLGLQRLAAATAAELGEAFRGDFTFETTSGRDMPLESPDRFELQLSCQAEIPEIFTREFRTEPIPESNPETPYQPVAVVGTPITGGPARHFPGFMSHALGRPVEVEVIADDPHAALSRYLTSGQFEQDRPVVLIWLVPIWANPSRYGDQPYRELVAAAADDCEPELAAQDDAQMRFDIAADAVRPTSTLVLEAEDAVSEAIFTFEAEDGQIRTRSVFRHDPGLATSKLYLPLSGLAEDKALAIHVQTDLGPTAPLRLSVCRGSS